MMKTNLNYQFVKNLTKPGRYSDALVMGFHIWVKSNGGKYFIFRYSKEGTSRDISLGSFRNVTIAEARIKAQQARDTLDKGSDPAAEKNASKALKMAQKSEVITFSEFALQCVENKRAEWKNQKHASQWIYTLETFAFPVIGNKDLKEISTNDILKILNPIWHPITNTASRLRGRIEWILASATAQGLRSGQNPAVWRGHLETILSAPGKISPVKHFEALPYRALPAFIENLQSMDSISALALEFIILNASRTSEVTKGLQSEVNGDIWIIPAARMKAKKEHRVPLCSRSLEILAIAKGMTPDSRYLFSRNGRPLSDMALSMLIRRLGEKVTVHGFRSTFRDWASEETNHQHEVTEMALAHSISNKVEAAYRRKDLLEKRRLLMQDWDYYCCSQPTCNVLDLKVA
jgi:integrase